MGIATAARADSSAIGVLNGSSQNDSPGGENNFEDVAQQLAAEIRKAPDEMDAVAALGHVRFQTALEIAIAEVWDLTQKSLPKADFQAAAGAKETRDQRDFEQQQCE